MTVHKPGNPRGAPRKPLYNVSAKFDDETYKMLGELEDERPNIQGRRSAVIREAVREMYQRHSK